MPSDDATFRNQAPIGDPPILLSGLQEPLEFPDEPVLLKRMGSLTIPLLSRLSSKATGRNWTPSLAPSDRTSQSCKRSRGYSDGYSDASNRIQTFETSEQKEQTVSLYVNSIKSCDTILPCDQQQALLKAVEFSRNVKFYV